MIITLAILAAAVALTTMFRVIFLMDEEIAQSLKEHNAHEGERK